jgi:hypothetical protein
MKRTNNEEGLKPLHDRQKLAAQRREHLKPMTERPGDYFCG